MINTWTIYGMVQINHETVELHKDFIERYKATYNKRFSENYDIKLSDLNKLSREELIKKYGKIIEEYDNSLPKGYDKYSEIVENGETRPVLYIPRNTSYGWKRLTAIYSDDLKEIYLGTIKRTLVYYGAKVWVNCPCIFYTKGDKTITLKADVFSHNRKIPAGQGLFHFNDKQLSLWKVNVSNGEVAETFNIASRISINDTSNYSFFFDPNYDYELAPDNGSGLIYLVSHPEDKTRLTVDVSTIIMNQYETQKLVARVHHYNYTSYIKSPTDIPQGGYVTFYVNGRKIGQGNINTAGFATVPYKGNLPHGTYTITATYTPDTPALQLKYTSTSGCGTVYLGTSALKPTITSQTPLCTYKNNSEMELKFKSDKILNGTVKLYIDGEAVLLNNSELGKEIAVNDTDTIKLVFDTLGQTTNKNYRWNYSGYHNLILKYSVDDGLGYPMEYYYYLDDFYIQIDTSIELQGEVDNTSVTKNGSTIYVGNNLFDESDGIVEWYSPANGRAKNTTIGKKITVKIINSENPDDIIDEGRVRLTFVTRTKENNMEENINNS